MAVEAPTDCEEIAYPGHPLPQTHPDRLATLAALFGMSPAHPARCRVLELGCTDGGNLIPMAATISSGDFVGIDLAEQPIARGLEIIRALSLSNILLRAQDILELSADLGQFDYIIAHGVYSWVPAAVRDKILELCGQILAPQGVAYISYNVYPGYRLRAPVREMLRFHVRAKSDPRERIAAARAFAQEVAKAQARDNPYPQLWRGELEEAGTHDEAVFFHDDLAEINAPLYFHQFAEHASRHGLQFLAEANFALMQDLFFPPAVAARLRDLAGDNLIRREQYLDFIRCRRFRQTLLCRADIPLLRPIPPEHLAAFRAASSVRPVAAKPDLRSSAEEEFRDDKGMAIHLDHPLAKTALVALAGLWPGSLPFPELLGKCRSLLGLASPGAGGDLSVRALGEMILELYSAGLVELSLAEPAFVARPGDRPVAGRLARLQARNQEKFVTNLRHVKVAMDDPFGRHLLVLLDGTRDRTALLADLAAAALSGAHPLVANGMPVADPAEVKRLLAGGLEPSLLNLAKLALLEG